MFLSAEARIRVTAPLWLWTGESASWHFITVPEVLADEIRAHSLIHRGGFGSVRVEATGGYLLPVKADVRRRAEIVAGEEVRLTLELL